MLFFAKTNILRGLFVCPFTNGFDWLDVPVAEERFKIEAILD